MLLQQSGCCNLSLRMSSWYITKQSWALLPQLTPPRQSWKKSLKAFTISSLTFLCNPSSLSLSLSCQQTTLITAKDAPFKLSFHSQGCWDSLWIEAWRFSIKFLFILSLFIKCVWRVPGLVCPLLWLSSRFVLVPVNRCFVTFVWGFIARLCASSKWDFRAHGVGMNRYLKSACFSVSAQTAGSEERVCGSEEQEEHQFSDVEESDDDEDDDDDDEEEEEESTSHEDPPSSVSSDTHPSTGGRSSSSRHSKQGTPDPEPPGPIPCTSQEPSPRGVWPGRRAASPGSRRAVFSRRGWKASPRAFSPSSESCSPSHSLSPRLEYSSPIQSLSPRTELPSPSRHVSPSPERGPSPIRPLSPLLPLSPSCYRSSQVPTPPSPLGMQHRTPGYLPWENPGTSGSHMRVVSLFSN